jgi:phosphatidylserine/phosphatidylglycerophosphate/cardiolipin synthase-like enzyme
VRLFSSFWFRGAVLFGLGIVLVLCFTFKQRTPAFRAPLSSLPQDPLIQAYFNHSQAAFYTEPYRHQQRLGDDLEQLIVETIDSAQSSIDVAAHELNLPKIAQALKARQEAGVQVRVVVEHTYRQPLSQMKPQQISKLDDRGRKKYQEFVRMVDLNQDGKLAAEEIAQRDAIVVLENANIPIIDDTADGSRGSALMHHKFVVVDQQTVIAGSANFTWSDIHGDFGSPESQGNANHLLKINSVAVAQLFTQEFNAMWGDQTSSPRFGLQKPYRSPKTITLAPNSTLTIQFSPTSTRQSWEQSGNGLIGRTLSQAKQTIEMALFVFSDQSLSNLLEIDRQRGVEIRTLIDPQFAYRDYSEGLDLMGVALADQQCQTEVENHPWKQGITSVGIPALPRGDLLHHKMGIVDRQAVITGSQNWSEAANYSNDETLLVVNNPTVAAHFEREFDRLYSTAILGIPPQLQHKLQQQKHCRTITPKSKAAKSKHQSHASGKAESKGKGRAKKSTN